MEKNKYNIPILKDSIIEYNSYNDNYKSYILYYKCSKSYTTIYRIINKEVFGIKIYKPVYGK